MFRTSKLPILNFSKILLMGYNNPPTIRANTDPTKKIIENGVPIKINRI